MLRTAMGPAIAAALADPHVIEVMVNPDGRLWLDRLGAGRIDTGERIEAGRGRTHHPPGRRAHAARGARQARRSCRPSCRRAASASRACCRRSSTAPCFAIRKPAEVLYRLDDYVADAHPDAAPGRALRRRPCASARTSLIAGGTSSGKTTLANALLAEIAELDERVVILEDTRELQCAAADCVALRTKPGVVTLADLVRSTLRLRPDRIIVGEVRGAEALDMLKAWNTGHPGGIATVHANCAVVRALRLEQLIQEAVVTVPRELIAEAIDVVVFIERPRQRAPRRDGRRVADLDAARRLRPQTPGTAGPARRSRHTEPCPCGADHRSRVHAVVVWLVAACVGCPGRGHGSGRRLRHALGGAAAAHPGIGRRAGRQDRRRASSSSSPA